MRPSGGSGYAVERANCCFSTCKNRRYAAVRIHGGLIIARKHERACFCSAGNSIGVHSLEYSPLLFVKAYLRDRWIRSASEPDLSGRILIEASLCQLRPDSPIVFQIEPLRGKAPRTVKNHVNDGIFLRRHRSSLRSAASQTNGRACIPTVCICAAKGGSQE